MRDETSVQRVATVRVEQSGIAQLVDLGRCGFAQFGIPESGPLNECAARLANALLGSEAPEQPWWIEIGPTPFSLSVDTDTWISVAGGERSIAIGSHRVGGGRAIRLCRLLLPGGVVLRLSGAMSGYSTYIAFSGEWDEPRLQGSISTIPGYQVAGLLGRRLQTGDAIAIRKRAATTKNRESGRIATQYVASVSEQSELLHWAEIGDAIHFLPGPEYEQITRAIAVSGDIVAGVSSSFDRRGIRLDVQGTSELTWSEQSESSPTAVGMIQWPSGGNPMILGPDRQTVGGYPRYGVVCTADLLRLGSLRPGQIVVLTPVTRAFAQEAYTQLISTLQQWETRFRVSSVTEGVHGS